MTNAEYRKYIKSKSGKHRGGLNSLRSFLKLPLPRYFEDIYEFSKTSEDHFQAMAVKWIRWKYPKVLVFAIPNGTHKGSGQSQELFKATGLMAGVSDLFIAQPNKWGFNGFFLELKRHKGGQLSDSQKKFLENADIAGYKTGVYKDLKVLTEDVEEYLK